MASFGVLRPPSTILFGAGVVGAVGSLAAESGRRILVCTDPTLAQSAHARTLHHVLRDAGLEVTVVDAAVQELPLPLVESTINDVRNLRPDCIVGFGGGSSIDLAKLIALGLTTDKPLDSFYGEHLVPGPTIPLIAVPTTAGTGSEVTPVAVLSDPRLALKVGISSPYLVPRAAVCDPDLTFGAPPHVTAYAGIDALAHAIEAYTAVERASWEATGGQMFVGKNVLTDRFALHAASCIAPNLLKAMDDEPHARHRMLEGSLCAGLAFASAGTAAAHALQYAIGGCTKTPHGLGVGLLLPHVMEFNRSVRDEEYADVARAMGEQEPSAAAAIERVSELGREIGLPASLRELGITQGQLPQLAEQTLGIKRLTSNNPVPLDLDAVMAILTAAWYGDGDSQL